MKGYVFSLVCYSIALRVPLGFQEHEKNNLITNLWERIVVVLKGVSAMVALTPIPHKYLCGNIPDWQRAIPHRYLCGLL